MPQIILHTLINAPIERCFDLSRSIDLHQLSTQQTQEKVVAGRMEGLIELGETVTWRAKHFGVWQNLTAKITAFDRPRFFCDEMVTGAFKSFRHEHAFIQTAEGTRMSDQFDFESPFGFLGKVVNRLFLTSYMTQLLQERNQVIKNFAESNQWKTIKGI